jgi:MoxR-like ATPase
MPIPGCPHCGQHLEIPSGFAGTHVTCRHCGTLAPLPAGASPAAVKVTLPGFGAGDPHPPQPAKVAAVARELIANVERVIVGKHEQVVLAVATLLAQGHLLLEDVPGVAKTMFARALAQSAGCSFKRIQCTPDLEPAEVLGEVFTDAKTGRLEFRFGPLFSQFVLVDEINRARARTQAAMLEAMGEASITAETITYPIKQPFMVIATQNPIEQEGTFPLPEAQKDRFLIRLSLGYPAWADEREMFERFRLGHPIDTLRPVTSPERLLACQHAVRTVRVGDDVCDYILAVVRATRAHPALRLGASPRGSLALFRLAQAMAAIDGHDTVQVDGIRALAESVLGHRVIVKDEHADRYRDGDGAAVVHEILAEGVVPGHSGACDAA